MTRQDWIDYAIELEAKAMSALLDEDEVAYELYWNRGRAAYANAAYGTEPDDFDVWEE